MSPDLGVSVVQQHTLCIGASAPLELGLRGLRRITINIPEARPVVAEGS